LVVRRSPDQRRRGQLLALATGATVLTRRGGRDRGGDLPGRVVFADEFMSGDHATVVRAGRGFQLVEREAGGPPANGLYVNGRRMMEGAAGVELADGDVLRLGATELVFKQLNLPPSDERT
jgi:pSer/pThr/pTyr-binding forkhead associated (FHA) protein